MPSRTALALLVILTLSLWNASPTAGSILDPCSSFWQVNSFGPANLLVCPAGDTDPFITQGFTIDITILDFVGNPIAFIPAVDFWLIDCDPLNDLILCGGSSSSNADAVTDVNGHTTMSATTLKGGGCVGGLALVVQGLIILQSPSCTGLQCEAIDVRSPDSDTNNVVDLIDLASFAIAYPPGAYDPCFDYNFDNQIGLVDLAIFAVHFPHSCF